MLLNDYYRRGRRAISERHALNAARVITLFFGLLGTAAAVYAAQIEAVSLWDPFLKLLNFVGGGLAGVFALGVFTKRANGIGALTGAAVSAIAVVLIQRTEVHFLLHGMVGFLASFIAGYLTSLLVPARSEA